MPVLAELGLSSCLSSHVTISDGLIVIRRNTFYSIILLSKLNRRKGKVNK